MTHNLEALSDDQLIGAYGDMISLLKARGIIRTKNVVGDLGEYLVVAHYNRTDGLPRLEAARTNETDVDAMAGNQRFSIKSTTVNRTGAFHLPESLSPDFEGTAAFEHVIVAILTDKYRLNRIHQFSWQEFLTLKQWSTRQKAWFIPLTKAALLRGRTIHLAKK